VQIEIEAARLLKEIENLKAEGKDPQEILDLVRQQLKKWVGFDDYC
jgi:hypothetical protein